MVSVVCSGCSTAFEKPLKEYNRQTRVGRSMFYCNRKCFGRTKGKENLGDGFRSDDHLARIQVLAVQSRTKFFGADDKVFGEMLRRSRQRKKGPTDLDVDYLRELWNSQSRCCALTGIELQLDSIDPVVRASLDRIDSRHGYIKGNIQFVSCSINWAKNSSTNDDVLRLVSLIISAARV